MSNTDYAAEPHPKSFAQKLGRNHTIDNGNLTSPVSLTALRQRRRSSIFRINRTRLFNKSGSVNTVFTNIKHRGHRFMADIFTTAVDMKWRWLILIFVLAFMVTWAGFGFFWWILCFFHGDFEHLDDENWEPCLYNTKSYVGAFLFSLETQTTIGYGYRAISESCSEGIILLILQSILAAFFESVLIGMILAKASRAKKRAETIVFSKNACIGQRDGQLVFMCRIGDIRSNSFLVESHVRMYMVKQKTTEEDEFMPVHFYNMDNQYDTGEDRIMVTTPLILTHYIDARSPFYDISKVTLHRTDFEVVIVLEGCVEQTGMTTQMRSSYIPEEIVWGHYFRNMTTKERGHYVCNFGLFDALYEREMLPYSAHDLERINMGQLPLERFTSSLSPKLNMIAVNDGYSESLDADDINDNHEKEQPGPKAPKGRPSFQIEQPSLQVPSSSLGEAGVSKDAPKDNLSVPPAHDLPNTSLRDKKPGVEGRKPPRIPSTVSFHFNVDESQWLKPNGDLIPDGAETAILPQASNQDSTMAVSADSTNIKDDLIL